jgi:hypothetical protein
MVPLPDGKKPSASRPTALTKRAEFTDVKHSETGTKRMANFTLRELAHSYHDRVLSRGFANPEIKAAYARVQAIVTGEKVERWFGNRRPHPQEKADVLTNPMEYFAETTEAFFSRNDFFPFGRAELKQHDPEMERLLAKLWGVTK